MSNEFEVGAVVSEISAHLGGVAAEVESEHDRWHLYLRAMDSPEGRKLLLRAVEVEPDQSVALSIVLEMMERLPSVESREWVRRLPPGKNRQFAEQRARDYCVMETLGEGGTVDGGPGDWSVWLQLRAAEVSTDSSLLTRLAETGGTKRVRRIAVDRLRLLRRGDPGRHA
ncbi:hypothetical protein [Streptomyces sp. NPDC048332]|uniref:hypothetical protein n=1 Tax=unclassified Streptomyces TaxID=2593676 RepID=UPI00341F2434